MFDLCHLILFDERYDKSQGQIQDFMKEGGGAGNTAAVVAAPLLLAPLSTPLDPTDSSHFLPPPPTGATAPTIPG